MWMVPGIWKTDMAYKACPPECAGRPWCKCEQQSHIEVGDCFLVLFHLELGGELLGKADVVGLSTEGVIVTTCIHVTHDRNDWTRVT